MEKLNIYKVLAFCGFDKKEITKELLEKELKKVENQEWEVYNVYHYINILVNTFKILDQLKFGVQFDIIKYYNDWGKSHAWFCKKLKWGKRKDFNAYLEVLDFMSEDKKRLHDFMLIYVWLYLLGN